MKRVWLVLGCVLLVAACAGEKKGENVLATFEGGSLTVEDVQAHYGKLKVNPRYRNKPEMLTPEYAFEHALDMEMVIAEGLRKKLHLDPRIRAEIHEFMANLFLKTMGEEMVPKIDRNAVTEEEMRAYYEQHRDQYRKEALYEVSLVTAAERNEAESLLAEIQKGTKSFDQAIAERAAAGKGAGGSARSGRFPLRRYPEELRGVIETLEPGTVSGPHPSRRGWCLLRLEGKTAPVQYSFEERREYIRNDVCYNRYREEWRKVYERLKKEFEVEIARERLDRFLAAERKEKAS
ncbi:MAG: peptidyl-prolyl cis-trans isomerase [Deltaproteobacteria bacterium]|nr:peptidyl-prolyl cis-trans isomerase [Deltaproteobacteria bacterium]